MSLATKYARSTSLAWLRVILVRGTQLIYLFLIARLLLPAEMGILQAVALGTSFIGGVVTPWLAWVMQQKALMAKEKEETVGTTTTGCSGALRRTAQLSMAMSPQEAREVSPG